VTVVNNTLEVAERPRPRPEAGQVLVRVHGAGLNRADLLQVAGGYPAPPGVPADVPGLEFAGVVEELGDGASGVTIGDRVFGVVAGGAQAEYVCVHASHCASVPTELDLVAMSGIPEAFITAHDAMVTHAAIAPGEWMLVHAVGSGVGTAALQLGKALDANVVGTSRTPDKIDRCRALGLDVGLVPTTKDGALDSDALAWSVVDATGSGADVTLDLVGGPYVASNVAAAAPRGRIVCIGTMAGPTATIPVAAVLGKRLRIYGTMLRGRDVEEKARATDAFARDVVPLLAARQVAPVVDAIVRLERARDAYDLLASNATFGKVILDCS
jgi:putative PIG3 family NAD(P)H quinone oxidoreductase